MTSSCLEGPSLAYNFYLEVSPQSKMDPRGPVITFAFQAARKKREKDKCIHALLF